MGHHFISYSEVDAKDFVARLVDELMIGPPPINVWLDKRELRPGLDWDEQIFEGIKACESLLFVMSRDSVTPNSVCKKEWTCALKYNKPVIPLRLHVDAELPFRLEPRQFIDFSDAFEPALAQLRNQLRWWTETAGLLQRLKDQLADAKRDLLRAPEAERSRIVDKIGELEHRIAHQERTVKSTQTTAQLPETVAPGRDNEGRPARREAGETVNSITSSHFQDRSLETRAGVTKSWEPDVLERARRDVAFYIGPMAKIIVSRAARSARTLDELYEAIAAEIPSPDDRQKFLASRPL